MYANTRRVMCLNIHAEEVGKALPTTSRQTTSNDTYTTFIFDVNVPIYTHKVFRLAKPLLVVAKSTLVHKHYWFNNTDSLHISKPKVSIVIFPLDNFWLKQLEIYNVSRLLKMTG